MSSALPKLPPIGGARATTSAYDERMTTPDRSRYQDDFYAWTQHCPGLPFGHSTRFAGKTGIRAHPNVDSVEGSISRR